MDTQHGDNLIRFDNLRQATDTIGEYAEVKAKAVPFESSNAKGTLRVVSTLQAVGELAKADGKKIKQLVTGS